MSKNHVTQNTKNNGLIRRTSGLMALEPRFMFDGAAASDAISLAMDVNSSESHNLPSSDAVKSLFSLATEGSVPAALGQAQAQVSQMVSDWLARPDAKTQLFRIFNGGNTEAEPSAPWSAAFDALMADIQQGDQPVRVELHSAAELNHVLGAFAEQGLNGERVIFLNDDWVRSGVGSQAIELVLAEEFGHAIDARLNAGADTDGDEGQAFAGVLMYGDANRSVTRAQNDHITLNLNGTDVSVETAANLAVAQTHYVPLAEGDIQTALKAISTATAGNIQTVIAITATGNGTLVVYDHWEDGYEADISNPLQASTKIWIYQNNTWYNDVNQNGVYDSGVDTTVSTTLTNGIKAAGASIILSNAVNPTSPLTVDFDGRDKIGTTKAVSVTRAGWSATPGTVLAGAVNVIDAGNAGLVYTLPVGQNVETVATGTNKLFEYTSAHIIATQNNTLVAIDKDGNGTVDLNVTLNEGQSYFVNGGLNAGAKITANKGVGVYLIAGDVGSAYENRWFALTPDAQWSNSYYAPVSTSLAADPAYVILYNPNNAAISLKYDTATQTGQTLTINANSTGHVLMPASAAHFYTTDGSKFFAVGVIDADATSNATHDWSYSLVPESYLTDKFVVGWGPGADNVTRAIASSDLNGSPVWVTTTANTTLYIDSTTVQMKDGSGTVVTGTVANGRTSFAVSKLQSYRVFDTSDKDQTGLTAYTLDGTLITAAWGEDPSIAGGGTPYLDMGTTVTPYPDYVLSKSAQETSPSLITGASDGDGAIELGEQVTYTVRLTNRAVIDLYNIVLKDNVTPADSATYITGSTVLTVYNTNGTKAWTIEGNTQTFFDSSGNVTSTSVNNSLAGNAFPLSGNTGYQITDLNPSTAAIDGLQRGGVVEISYRVQIRDTINKTLADSDYVVSNSVEMTAPNSVVKTKVNSTQLTVNVTDGEVFFTTSLAGTTVATDYTPGNAIYLKVNDGDQNTTGAADTVWVKVTNTTTNEYEYVQLTETSASSGVFTGALNTTSAAGVGANNSSNLNVAAGSGLKVEYVDPTALGLTAPTTSQVYDSNNWATGIDNPTNFGTTGDYRTGTNTNSKTLVVSAPPSVDGKVEFLSFAGNAYGSVSVNFKEGDTLGLQVTDLESRYTGNSVQDTLTVNVTNATTGEVETVTLTETTNTSGIFRGTLATSVAAAHAPNNSGTLKTGFGDAIAVTYADALTGGSYDNASQPGTPAIGVNSASAGANRDVASVVQVKTLYLSATNDLDRVDPVGTSDNSLSQTTALSTSGGGTRTMSDSFATQSYSGGTGWTSGSPWTEVNDNASVNSGRVMLTDGSGLSNDTFGIMFSGGNSGSVTSLQRTFDALTAPATLNFNYKVSGLDSGDTGLKIYYTTNGTNWIELSTVVGRRSTGTTDSGFTAYPNDSTNGNVTETLTALPTGATGIRFSYASSKSSDRVFIDNVTLTSAGVASATAATFTQAIPLATELVLPASGMVNIATHISAETGLISGSYSNITAALTYTPSGGGSEVTIAPLGAATYAESATAGVGVLNWSGEVNANGITVPKGAVVKLLITNNQTGASFKIDYDSSAKPSRIDLPTTTVIKVVDVDGLDNNNDGDILDAAESDNGNGTQRIGFYDAGWSTGVGGANGGALISAAQVDAGQTVYVRVKVSDPFGAYDISSLKLEIDGPGSAAGVDVTVNSATAVYASGPYKVFEYAWKTVNTGGVYDFTVTANEGTEGIKDVARGQFSVLGVDVGTPSKTEFITALGGTAAGASYAGGTTTGYVRVTDLDEADANAGKTVSVKVNGTTYTLTQTAANSGVFERAITGLSNGTVMSAEYVDGNDVNDISMDTIFVQAPGNAPPAIDLDTLSSSTDIRVRFTEGGSPVGFVVNPASGTTVSDADTSVLRSIAVSIPTAQIRDGANEVLSIQSVSVNGTIALDFANAASIPAFTFAGVTWNVAATVSGGVSQLVFSQSGGGLVTQAQAEQLVEALRYANNLVAPTQAARVFAVTANDGGSPALNSNTAHLTVDVVADPPALSVSGVRDVSEGSYAVFELSLDKVQTVGTGIRLQLTSGTAALLSDLQSTDMEVVTSLSTPLGSGTTVINGGTYTLPANSQMVYVRVLSLADGTFEGNENFSLTASFTSPALLYADRTGTNTSLRTGASAADIAVIVDDGSGRVYDGLGGNTGTPDDDRQIDVIADGPVNEGSLYAMFTVNAPPGQVMNLSLQAASSGTAATFAGFTWEYSTNGTTWTTYSWNGTSGDRPTVPANGKVFVRVAVQSELDSTYEGPETFALKASLASDPNRFGAANTSIVDDGSGAKYGPNVDPSTGPNTVTTALDDDRDPSVNHVTINEASAHAEFLVSTVSGCLITGLDLVSGTANIARTDATSIQYWNGTTWLDSAVSGMNLNLAAHATLRVRVAIQSEQDNTYEGPETFQLKIISNGVIGAIYGTATIADDGTGTGGTDDDRPTLTVSGVDDVSEGSFSVYTVTLDKPLTVNTAIKLQLADGSALLSEDLEDTIMQVVTSLSTAIGSGTDVLNGGQYTLPAGAQTFYVRVLSHGDAVFEGAENFTLTASFVPAALLYADRTGTATTLRTGASGSDTSTVLDDGTGRVYDGLGAFSGAPDNDRPSFSVDDVTVNEAAGTLTFTVTLSGPASQATSVGYALMANTAEFGTDYTSANPTGTLHFAAGETSKTITLTVLNDTPGRYEGSETFYVNLSNPTGVSITDAQGVGTIKDDGTGDANNGGSGSGVDDDRPLAVNDVFSLTLGGQVNANVILRNDGPAPATQLLIQSVDYVDVLGVARSRSWAQLDASTLQGYSKQVSLADGTLYISQDGESLYEHAGRRFLVTATNADGLLEYNATGSVNGWTTVALSSSVVVSLQDIQDGRLRFTPAAGVNASQSLAAQVVELDWTTDGFTYAVADAGGLSPSSATVTYSVSGGAQVTYQAPIAPAVDADVDGITTRVESVLANRARGIEAVQPATYTLTAGNLVATGQSGQASMNVGIAFNGDLNIDQPDSMGDGYQNGVTTFSWINSTYFNASNADPLTSDVASIVTLVAEDSNTSRGVPNPLIQLRDVVVNPLTSPQTLGLESIFRFTPNWSPMGFSAEIRSDVVGVSNIDQDPSRAGAQWRFTLDISRTSETTDTFMGFVKWIDQSIIDAYAAANLALTDLDGHAITQVGWVDFTQRSPGGDGVAIANASGNILSLTYIITDNSFGDSDLTVGRITDPGMPVFIQRQIAVANPGDVSEGADAEFVVTLNAAKLLPTTISLTLQDAAGGTDSVNGAPQDYAPTMEVYYMDGQGQRHDLAVSNGQITLPSGVTEFHVVVHTTQDTDNEGAEAFTLTATLPEGGAAVGHASIVDDGRLIGGVRANDDRPQPSPPTLVVLPPTVAPVQVAEPLPPQVTVPLAFASALQPLVQKTTAPAEPALPLVDVKTSNSGYQIPVNETAPPGLTLYSGVTDQFVQSTDVATKVSLPFDAFMHSNKDAVIKLQAKQSDNSPLPQWVQFDPVSGVFEVVPPKGFKGKLDLKVIARDDDGREATAMFQMFIGEQQTLDKPQSRSSFSEKLRMAGNRPITLMRMTESGPHKSGVNEAKMVKVRAG